MTFSWKRLFTVTTDKNQAKPSLLQKQSSTMLTLVSCQSKSSQFVRFVWNRPRRVRLTPWRAYSTEAQRRESQRRRYQVVWGSPLEHTVQRHKILKHRTRYPNVWGTSTCTMCKPPEHIAATLHWVDLPNNQQSTQPRKIPPLPNLPHTSHYRATKKWRKYIL